MHLQGKRRSMLIRWCTWNGLIALAILLMASCRTATVSAPSPSPSPTPSGEASTCTAEQVHEVLDRFTHALASGDTVALDAIFTGPELFQWYSSDAPGERIDQQARDRSTLMRYLTQRQRVHERMEVTSFRFNGNAASFGNFEARLTRQADDLPPTPYQAKGAATCSGRTATIAVWSMARDA
jgi:hypothetical protein